MQTLASLRRPRLLIRAARFALRDYNRRRDLKRLMRAQIVPTPPQAIEILLAEEARLETARQGAGPGYDPGRHIAILVALMGEARLVAPHG